MQALSAKVRRFIRKRFRNAGFQRRIAPDFVDIMLDQNIDVVLDIGANDGDYGREIRDRGYKGLIISFEPNPTAYDRLMVEISGDSNWISYPWALGEVDGWVDLQVAENDAMSSIKGLTSFGATTGAKPLASTSVKVTRLDTLFQLHPEFLRKTYVKIDTQGYEMEILRGAGHRLEDIIAIQAEIALVHTYVDELDWLEILFWMRSQRFEVATAICNSRVNAQAREFDFVFVRRTNSN